MSTADACRTVRLLSRPGGVFSVLAACPSVMNLHHYSFASEHRAPEGWLRWALPPGGSGLWVRPTSLLRAFSREVPDTNPGKLPASGLRCTGVRIRIGLSRPV